MKTVKFLRLWLLAAVTIATVSFYSYGQSPSSEKGVVINGVRWATRNVDTPGTFAAKPEDPGMFYQWNRKKGWAATGSVTGWDKSTPTGDTWTKSNDPSPVGWRVPTLDEIKNLFDKDKVNNVWTTQNGVNGRKFTDKTTGNSIFLPAVGYRNDWDDSDGTLHDAGTNGYYWSSTGWYDNEGFRLRLNRSLAAWNDSDRYRGLNVRAVAE
jgi:uncharacterized protein (TIGR02145 family)